MDKNKTGTLIAQARKERGLTQSQLAERLHITGKAVSKWETGVSLPDTGLLIPLSEALGLTVTELLEGRRTEAPGDRTPEQVEDIVKTAIAYSEEAPEAGRTRRKRWALIYAACLLTALAELAVLWFLDVPLDAATGLGRGWLGELAGTFGIAELLALLFGAALLLAVPERLPGYYDDNKISTVSFGAFRMNMLGLCFNNRNWPHILRALRLWCVFTSVLTIPLAAAWAAFFPAAYRSCGLYALLALVLGGLLIPVYVVGKKYE